MMMMMMMMIMMMTANIWSHCDICCTAVHYRTVADTDVSYDGCFDGLRVVVPAVWARQAPRHSVVCAVAVHCAVPDD